MKKNRKAFVTYKLIHRDQDDPNFDPNKKNDLVYQLVSYSKDDGLRDD